MADNLLAANVAKLTFLSSDTRLLQVAQAEGLQIDDPQNH
jgi:hypothetical protein